MSASGEPQLLAIVTDCPLHFLKYIAHARLLKLIPKQLKVVLTNTLNVLTIVNRNIISLILFYKKMYIVNLEANILCAPGQV